MTVTPAVSPRGLRPRMLRYNVLNYNVTVNDNDPGRVSPSTETQNVTWCYTKMLKGCDNDPGRVSSSTETENVTSLGVTLQLYRLRQFGDTPRVRYRHKMPQERDLRLSRYTMLHDVTWCYTATLQVKTVTPVSQETPPGYGTATRCPRKETPVQRGRSLERSSL